jgi:hypothetical protein
VLPGDAVVGDESGVLFSPPQIADALIKAAEDTVYIEDFKREMIRGTKIPRARHLPGAQPRARIGLRGVEEDAPAEIGTFLRLLWRIP